MVGTIKIQAPWTMKRLETDSAGKITVSDETPTVDLLPDPPKEPEPPLKDLRCYRSVPRWWPRPSIFFIRKLPMRRPVSSDCP
jgi:hypothetical protein